jgi:hypothetical protein
MQVLRSSLAGKGTKFRCVEIGDRPSISHSFRPPSSTDEDFKLAADPIDFDLATKLSDANTKDQVKEEDFDILPDLSSLKLWPDPELLVSALEQSGRPDLSSRFFVRCLQAYQDRSMDERSKPE